MFERKKCPKGRYRYALGQRIAYRHYIWGVPRLPTLLESLLDGMGEETLDMVCVGTAYRGVCIYGEGGSYKVHCGPCGMCVNMSLYTSH